MVNRRFLSDMRARYFNGLDVSFGRHRYILNQESMLENSAVLARIRTIEYAQ